MQDTPCLGKQHLFFSFNSKDKERAKKICARCPWPATCLSLAMAHNARDGIWGGLDTNERDDLASVVAAIIF